MSSFEVKGLDAWEKTLILKFSKEYPSKAKAFLTNTVNECKGEALERTPKGPTGNLKKGWKTKTQMNGDKGHYSATLRNSAPHAHLIENGHITKNGGWWEGKHMLENTMTNKQPWIDSEIDKLIDTIFDEV